MRSFIDGKTTASRTEKERAARRTDSATSKWRTTMRDHKIVQTGNAWTVTHWDGTVVGTFADITAATAALS